MTANPKQRALWLPDVLRAAGLKVVEVDGWETRGKEPTEWLCQVFHHTVSGRHSGNAPSLNVCINGRGGPKPVPGPLCNTVVGRDGTWYMIASGAANHPGESFIPHRGGISSGVKYYALGHECENDGVGEPWPAVQLDSIERGEAAIADHLGWRKDTSEVFGHKEIARPKGRKIDPTGIDMDDHRARVSTWRGHPTTKHPKGPLMALTDEQQADLLKKVNEIHRETVQSIPPDDTKGQKASMRYLIGNGYSRLARILERLPVKG